MTASRTPGSRRMSKTHKFSIAGLAAVGASAVAFSLVPGNAVAGSETQAVPASQVAWSSSVDTAKATALQTSIAEQNAFTAAQVKAAAQAKAQAAANAKAAAAAQAKATAAAEAKVAAAAKAKAQAQAAAKKRAAEQAASRAAARKPVYANNLDGWIREALDIMKKHDIPGTYHGIHKNIMRESSGNPRAINNWDINAINGVPSKGLLQVIKPTFDAYHVPGTSWDQYDPVANIVAACNYAADRYGSMDNVNSAY
ncbi:transglycosylase SLT domain-containing protein [Streptomyces sp. NBC_01619]|uniref:Transglycosylase SLT domain-containing protein n=1 Tax=Streptomyces pratisoli TaxID=3139917 RepID=A0ACC6QDF6_9ACTN|nr:MULTISPECIES: transglycosylase SLT domain-containing protein [unclassified Streptomyces]MCX4509896.1 transglycosylase SLT domain-containing protein [Streptomyces sp. NBC_01619]